MSDCYVTEFLTHKTITTVWFNYRRSTISYKRAKMKSHFCRKSKKIGDAILLQKDSRPDERFADNSQTTTARRRLKKS